MPSVRDVDASAQMEVLLGVGSWAVCSVGMMVTNKIAIGLFPLECTLVSMQMLATVIAMLVTWNSLHFGSLWDVLRWLMVVPFFSGMLLTSILALKTSPMSLVITFRVLSPLVSLMIEQFYPNPARVSVEILGSMLLMLVGCGMYTSGMNGSGYTGIFWVMLNSFFAVGDRLLQRLMLAKDQHPVDISKTGVTLLNNATGTLPLLVVMYFTGEIYEIPEAFAKLSTDGYAIAMVIASCLVGVGIGYCGVWAQSLISATSFLVLVNVNKFAIIFIEVTVLKNKNLAPIQIAGCIVAILAGVWYGKAKENVDAAARQAEEKLPLSSTAKAN